MTYDVIIVGCGPVGGLAANLLGRSGLSVLILEKEVDLHPLPRAVHIDHEMIACSNPPVCWTPFCPMCGRPMAICTSARTMASSAIWAQWVSRAPLVGPMIISSTNQN